MINFLKKWIGKFFNAKANATKLEIKDKDKEIEDALVYLAMTYQLVGYSEHWTRFRMVEYIEEACKRQAIKLEPGQDLDSYVDKVMENSMTQKI
jgi:hypothetical protein